MKFYIVNDLDKPHPPLVAYETLEGNLNYLDRSKKQYDGMEKDRATSIEDFGFEVRFLDNVVIFQQCGKSIAAYADGRPREWQGGRMFARSVENIKDAKYED
jgi:hypothetical protein